MPQIGWIEILVIVVLTIVIVGPKDIPIVLRKIGAWIRAVKMVDTSLEPILE